MLLAGTLLCFVESFLEDSEGFAGDVAFEATADFSCGFAFGGAAREYRWLACRAFGENLGRERHASRHSKQQPFCDVCFQKLLCF